MTVVLLSVGEAVGMLKLREHRDMFGEFIEAERSKGKPADPASGIQPRTWIRHMQVAILGSLYVHMNFHLRQNLSPLFSIGFQAPIPLIPLYLHPK